MTETKKISKDVYTIDKFGKMNVPVKIYASEHLLKDMKKDNCLEQMENVAQLPGIEKHSIVLPDAHLGYGFCIGGVAAFNMEEGIISPGGVGYDINCLSKNSKILNELGYWKEIQDYKEEYGKESFSILDKENTSLNTSLKTFVFIYSN